MKKQALIDSLLETDFITGIVKESPCIETKLNGDKVYVVNVREEVGTVFGYRDIPIIVVDEGKITERAGFLGEFPSKQIRTEQDVIDTEAIAAAQKATVLSKIAV